MQVTETITSSMEVLTLKPSYPIADRLRKIVNEIGIKFYKQYNDSLSCDLIAWSEDVLEIAGIKDVTEEKHFIKLARPYLIELVSEIAVDTFNLVPLNDPVLIIELKRTCEKMFITECNHGKPLTLQVHNFALEILKWARDLIAIPAEGTIICVEELHKPAPEAYLVYRSLVREAYAANLLSQVIVETKEHSELMKILDEAIDRRSEEKLKKATVEVEKTKVELSSLIKESVQIHKKILNALESKVDKVSEEKDAAKEEIIKLRLELFRMQQSITHLSSQYNEKCRQVEELKRKLGKKKRFLGIF